MIRGTIDETKSDPWLRGNTPFPGWPVNDGLHAKRVLSLSNATLGVIITASLAVSMIGQGRALARGLITKHAIKPVDRLLSNEGIAIDAALRHWVAYVV